MDKTLQDFLTMERFLSQDRFVFSNSTQTLYGGGVGSGKTRSLIERALFLACFIPGNIGLIGRYTATELETTTQAQFFEELSDNNLSDLILDIKRSDNKVILRTHDNNNPKPLPSTIFFRHVFDPRPDKKHLASLNLGFFGGDQIEDWEPHIWNDLQGRLRHKRVHKAFSFGVYNPKGHGWWWKQFKLPAIQAGRIAPGSLMERPNPDTALIERIPALLPLDNPDAIHPHAQGFRVDQVRGLNDKMIEVSAYRANPDMICYCTVTEENTTLRPDYVRNLRLNNPPEWVARFVDGSDEGWEGQVYKEFKGPQSVHCITPFPVPEHWQTIVGIDCGGDAPWAVIVARFDPIEGDCVITNEYYQAGVLIAEIAEWIKNPAYSGIPKWDAPNVMYVCDPENAQAIREFAENHGLPIQRAKKGPKLPGIYLAAGYFHRRHKRIKTWPGQDYKHELAQQRGEVIIHDAPYLWVFAENCPNWVREHFEWKWARDIRTLESKERPEDKNDHTCDATIYLLRERPDLQKIMDEDPRMDELKRKDFFAYLDARSIRRAMDEYTDSWTPPKGQPCGEAFRGEVGGLDESANGDNKIEW